MNELTDFCAGKVPSYKTICKAQSWAQWNGKFYDIEGGELDDLIHDYLTSTTPAKATTNHGNGEKINAQHGN